MDTLIRGGTLVPCDSGDRVFPGDVLVSRGRIVALGLNALGSATGLVRVLDADGCAVIPGLIQSHVHLCQTLFRGLADDMPLLPWLHERIWPLEAAHDPTSLRASADLGLTELLLGGTTTVLDMGTVHHHDAVFEAMRDAGIRGASGKTMMDAGGTLPAGLRESTRSSMDTADALCTRWNGAADGRLGYAYAPRFILSCTRELLRAVAITARARGVLVHTHAAEHPGERMAVRKVVGKDDVDALADDGLVGPGTVIAHGVQLTAAQRKRMGKDGTRVVHCPSANLKLGSGIAAVARMHEAGMVVGLGADGAPCNNNLDVWTEMRHAALLARYKGDITALTARRVLRMATADGARVLGLEREIGTLEVGMKADITVVELTGAHTEPGGDVVGRLVFAAQARDVRHVMVDGRVLVKNHALLTLDPGEVVARARVEARKILGRAGLAGA